MKSLIQTDCSNYYIKRLILLCLVIIFLNSCTKKSNTTVQEYPALPQNVEGFVFLHNEFGQFQQSNAGVTVYLDSTSFTATTDTAGKFTLPNVPAGNYTITYSKSGYGTYKSSYSDFLGGETYQLPTTNLYAMPTTTVTGLATQPDTINNNSFIKVSGKLNPPGSVAEPRNIILFAGSYASVSPNNYTQSVITTSYDTSFSIILNAYPYFSAGQTIYYVVYGISGSSTYKDNATGKMVFSAMGATPSNVTSAVAP